MNESELLCAASICDDSPKLRTWPATMRKPKTSGFSERLRRTGLKFVKESVGWMVRTSPPRPAKASESATCDPCVGSMVPLRVS